MTTFEKPATEKHTAEKPTVAIVSSSLSSTSRSRVGAGHAARVLDTHGVRSDWLDLAELNLLPYPRSERDPALLEASARFNRADAWLLATPVYNFGVSGTLLSFLHYTLGGDGDEMWKPFIVLASMSGLRSALSVDTLSRTLMLERNAVAVGPALVGFAGDFDVAGNTVSQAMGERMERQLGVFAHYVKARQRLTLEALD